MELSNNALDADTAPNDVHVDPSVEYCHVPLPVNDVIASPLCDEKSTSFKELDAKMSAAVLLDELVSSLVPAKLNTEPSLIVGASLTLVTTIDAVSVAELNAVVPPLLDASTLLPAVPLVPSQARKVKSFVVPFSPLGSNRIKSVERNSSADESDTVPTFDQLVPPSVEYCQTPGPLFRVVIAMPSTDPESTSEIGVPPSLAKSCATVWPPLLTSSSVIVGRVRSPELSKTGASLTAVTLPVTTPFEIDPVEVTAARSPPARPSLS
ncbi:hypothetical protein Pla22_28790 [Rubripirellula amarantea]|uniref:Uncharacterized protein n=1 Tax=Rubripirellula amarantea TaxID=2527999 RepID=A0A5C5WJ24_9BACT|nr:hypothetical protein Pla22_28790 [Rubripirellula amarantea]